MKKLIVLLGLFICTASQAQFQILEIIRQGVKKVIIAVDLKIQRLQNKTIWLQNAQKTLENEMSKLRLDEVKDWVGKQRSLYADYFEELKKVKLVLSSYRRVKDIIGQQVQVVKEYKDAWALFRQDKNFTKEELDHLFAVYSGMLAESSKFMDQLYLVINAFVTQMSDGKRLEIINSVADNVEKLLMDLKQFNEENKIISLQRATDQTEIRYLKKLYGM